IAGVGKGVGRVGWPGGAEKKLQRESRCSRSPLGRRSFREAASKRVLALGPRAETPRALPELPVRLEACAAGDRHQAAAEDATELLRTKLFFAFVRCMAARIGLSDERAGAEAERARDTLEDEPSARVVITAGVEDVDRKREHRPDPQAAPHPS